MMRQAVQRRRAIAMAAQAAQRGSRVLALGLEVRG